MLSMQATDTTGPDQADFQCSLDHEVSPSPFPGPSSSPYYLRFIIPQMRAPRQGGGTHPTTGHPQGVSLPPSSERRGMDWCRVYYSPMVLRYDRFRWALALGLPIPGRISCSTTIHPW